MTHYYRKGNDIRRLMRGKDGGGEYYLRHHACTETRRTWRIVYSANHLSQEEAEGLFDLEEDHILDLGYTFRTRTTIFNH